MTSLWIDTDMGFDDMLAILMVKRSSRQVAGCSLVYGCASLAQVMQNAAGFLQLFNWPVAMHAGAAEPLVRDCITAEHVLGKSGLPTLGKGLPDSPPLPDQIPALQALINWLEGVSGNAEILALGPLTNIARLVQARPDLLTRLARLTWMGGAATRGNQTPAAEFNAFADPDAVAVVCRSGLRLRMVDLDTCRQVSVTNADLHQLAQQHTLKAKLLHDLFGGYIDIGLSRGRASMALYDPVAAAAVIDEHAVAFDSVGIDVNLSRSEDYGRTLIDRHPVTTAMHQIGTHANFDRIRSMALAALSEAAQ